MIILITEIIKERKEKWQIAGKMNKYTATYNFV